MAFINMNDFSIVSNVEDKTILDQYFECDDLIAPAISLLNKKGYKTTFCCSGHPFSNINVGLLEDEPKKEDFQEIGDIIRIENTYEYLQKIKYNDDIEKTSKEYPYCVISNNVFCDIMYVAFEEEYFFPDLPGNAYIDDGNIYWELDETAKEGFELVTKIYEMNKIFYEWVENLDDLTNKEDTDGE